MLSIHSSEHILFAIFDKSSRNLICGQMWLSNTSDVDISGYFRALFELHILLDRSSFKVASFAFFLYLIMRTVDTDSQTKSNSDFCIMSVSSFYNDMANLFSSLIFAVICLVLDALIFCVSCEKF